MINKIENCKNRNISESFNTLHDVVKFVTNPPSDHIKAVNEARAFDRKSEQYREIKINKLPAICINFNFSYNYISGKNVSIPTGYLYLDVDNLTEKEIDINTTYVCAYWRSLSNEGITLVVKVKGLTSANLKIATHEVATLLDIPYDDKAVSIDRLTVLSYDPNAFFNDNTEVIPLDEIISVSPEENMQEETEKDTHHNTIKNTYSIGYDCNGVKMRYNNLEEKLLLREYSFDENGFCDLGATQKLKYAEVYFPFRKVVSGERENIFKSIAYQLIALNKNVPQKNIRNLLFYINKKSFFPMLKNKEMTETIRKIYQQINDIIPQNNAEKRFIYDKSRNLSPSDKRKLNIKIINKDRVERTQTDLLEILNSWDFETFGKQTIKNITTVSGKNKKTVQKYHQEIKIKVQQKYVAMKKLRRDNLIKAYLSVS